MIDVDGKLLPTGLWHGSVDALPEFLRPASEVGEWWRVIEASRFQRLEEDDLDEDERLELVHEYRTSYGNIVHECLKHSDDPKLQALASEYGLERLGQCVSILFVSPDRHYVESTYGPSVEIDLEADGLLTAIRDENALRTESWLLVFEAGSPFPIKHAPSFLP